MLKQKPKSHFLTALKIFLFSLLISANLQTVFVHAQTADTYTNPACLSSSQGSTKNNLDRNQYSSFNVNCLSVKDQNQTYLKAGNPVAAFILQIINTITLIAASLSFLAIVAGGFMQMSSAGDETRLNKGKEMVTKAVVGLVLTLSSYFIVSFVQNIFFETAPK